jgi:hypothetical protein
MTIPVWCRSIRCQAFPWAEVAAAGLLIGLTLVLRRPGESVTSVVMKTLHAIENLGDME